MNGDHMQVKMYIERCTKWPKKVKTPSILLIHNHILLESALKKSEKLYKISNKSSNVSIMT